MAAMWSSIIVGAVAGMAFYVAIGGEQILFTLAIVVLGAIGGTLLAMWHESRRRH